MKTMSETAVPLYGVGENDLDQRALALDLSQTFIVRAPAGSGKTDLLTRRFLKLLAAVDEPEEILAITFTRAATAEMRSRVLQHLEEAQTTDPAPDEDERVKLARAALANSEARGWRILEQSQRLNIETIDSLCLRIAHGQPLLSRMGGRLGPVERADLMYAQAARQTLGQLGGKDAALNNALMHLLAMRDNNLPDCQKLIAEMLAQRDQWVRAFPLVDDVRLGAAAVAAGAAFPARDTAGAWRRYINCSQPSPILHTSWWSWPIMPRAIALRNLNGWRVWAHCPPAELDRSSTGSASRIFC